MGKITYTQITIDDNDPKNKVDSKETLQNFYNVISIVISDFNTQTGVLTSELKAAEGRPELLMALATKYTPILAQYYSSIVKKYASALGKFPLEYKIKVAEAIANSKKNGVDTDIFLAIHNKMEAEQAQRSKSQKKDLGESVVVSNSTGTVH